MQSSGIRRYRLLTNRAGAWQANVTKTSGRTVNNDRHGIHGGKQRNFDGARTDKRCKLQCTMERNWFYGGDAGGGRDRRIPLNNFSRRLCLLYSHYANCFLSIISARFYSMNNEQMFHLVITRKKKIFNILREKKKILIPHNQAFAAILSRMWNAGKGGLIWIIYKTSSWSCSSTRIGLFFLNRQMKMTRVLHFRGRARRSLCTACS